MYWVPTLAWEDFSSSKYFIKYEVIDRFYGPFSCMPLDWRCHGSVNTWWQSGDFNQSPNICPATWIRLSVTSRVLSFALFCISHLRNKERIFSVQLGKSRLELISCCHEPLILGQLGSQFSLARSSVQSSTGIGKLDRETGNNVPKTTVEIAFLSLKIADKLCLISVF